MQFRCSPISGFRISRGRFIKNLATGDKKPPRGNKKPPRENKNRQGDMNLCSWKPMNYFERKRDKQNLKLKAWAPGLPTTKPAPPKFRQKSRQIMPKTHHFGEMLVTQVREPRHLDLDFWDTKWPLMLWRHLLYPP